MLFQWDETKRLKNIERHNLDFLDADILFAGPLIVGKAKTVEGESRSIATGMLDDTYVTAIYTVRDGVIIRIISLRRARREERKRCTNLHGS